MHDLLESAKEACHVYLHLDSTLQRLPSMKSVAWCVTMAAE
jgi:hypothetical protein